MKHQNESTAHRLLKFEAMNELRQLGYDAHTEYRFHIVEKLWIVDVVGFKENESIAIECGRTPREKIEALQPVFTKVLKKMYSVRVYPKKERLVAQRILATTNRGVSKVFGTGITVIPVGVRNALNVKDGEKIVWIVENGKWIVERA